MGRNKQNVATESTTEQSTILTPEEKGIFERVSRQDTDWFTLTEADLNDFSLSVNPLDLKDSYPEAWKLQVEKQYAFRWCERKPSRADELTRSISPPMRWAIVTRTTLPQMEQYVDPVLGCVAQLDQMLLFKPWSHHEMVIRAKRELADAKANAGKMDSVASRRAPDNVRVRSGEDQQIRSGDIVEYEDTSIDQSHDVEDLVVDE